MARSGISKSSEGEGEPIVIIILISIFLINTRLGQREYVIPIDTYSKKKKLHTHNTYYILILYIYLL